MSRQADLARAYEESTSARRKAGDGVVVTPVEIVDHINQAARDMVKTKHRVELTDPRVQIIDPFAGTGIFFARMLETAAPNEVQLLIDKMYGLELDPEAAAIADANVKQVARERGAIPPARPVVICADTFSIPTSQPLPPLFDEVLRTGTHPYAPKTLKETTHDRV